jgi:hypothetical protein
MGFSNQERINMNSKALAAGVIDANPVAQWYESRNAFSFIVNGDGVLTEFSSVLPAGSLSVAQTNATNNPTVIQDKSQVADAIRMTAVAGTNNSTWIAYSTYNDASSGVLKNWIQPQLVPQTSGASSNGYAIVLYDGDPNGTGTEITTTDGTTGTGENKTVGWIFQYSTGILLLADDFKGTISDPYILGFRYIGATATSASTTSQRVEFNLIADESIVAGDILRVVIDADAPLTAGRVVKANGTVYAQSEVVGIANGSASQGDSVKIVSDGLVGVKFSSPPASTSNGQNIFLSTTNGIATLTPPSGSSNSVIKIGKLVGADGSNSIPNVVLNIGEPIAP